MLILFLLFAKPGTSNTNLADAAFISKIDIIYIFIFFAIIVCAAIGVQNDFSRTSLFLNCIFTNYIKHSIPRARNIQIVSFRSRQELSIQRRPQDSGISTIFLIPSRWFTKGKAGSLYNRCFGAGRILNRRTRSKNPREK